MLTDDVGARGERREELQADCGNCFGLCCVALAFARSADFAIDKEAGEPCTNLKQDFDCGIHADLRESGFKGCTVFECFGAGQKVAQTTFEGRSWLEAPTTRQQMFDVFPVMRQLHELLWYLSEAMEMPAARAIREDILAAYRETERLTLNPPEKVLAIDVDTHRDAVNTVLALASELARSGISRARRPSKLSSKARPGADLIGAQLAHQDLRGTNLRGAYLIAADLRFADLRSADLIGADLRDADLRGADLSESLFLTSAQVNAAKGDATTKLPPALAHPVHWAR